MKVLYLGHFFENSSWTTVAKENLKALSLYCNVAWRPIVINKKIYPNDISHLYGTLDGITHCIQHVIPDFMEKTNIPCVGFFEQETNDVKAAGWTEKLESMDQIWNPNKYHCDFNNPKYRMVRHPTEINKYLKSYPKIKLDGYTFYTIAEFNKRKRLSAIIEAFHLAFNRDDNVNLIIKTSKQGVDKNELLKELIAINNLIKDNLKLNKCKDPIFIVDYLTDEQILGMHQSCDCYVNASYGEAHCIPILDALGFKNQVITSDVVDYAKEYAIESRDEACFGAEQYVENLHTGLSNWKSISALELSKKMKALYKEGKKESNFNIFDFSYKQVGETMYKNLLELS